MLGVHPIDRKMKNFSEFNIIYFDYSIKRLHQGIISEVVVFIFYTNELLYYNYIIRLKVLFGLDP